MARLVKSVAKETNDFKEIDNQMAYMVFIAEKEFNVGAITEDYLAMKFFNLFEKDNIELYNKTQKGDSGGGGIGKANTLGG